MHPWVSLRGCVVVGMRLGRMDKRGIAATIYLVLRSVSYPLSSDMTRRDAGRRETDETYIRLYVMFVRHCVRQHGATDGARDRATWTKQASKASKVAKKKEKKCEINDRNDVTRGAYLSHVCTCTTQRHRCVHSERGVLLYVSCHMS